MKNDDTSYSSHAAELRFHLAFRDPALEDAYLERMYFDNRKWLIGVLTLGVVMLYAFAPFDLPGVSAAQGDAVRFIRLCIWGPVQVVGLICVLTIKRPRFVIALGTFSLTYSGICLGAYIHAAGASALEYILVIDIQFLLFLYFLNGIPLRWRTAAAIVIYATQIAAVIPLHAGEKQLLWMPGLGVICFLMTVAAYRFERTSRENFIAQRQLQAEYSQRLSTERDRVRWLETIAGFLRHELKNSMTGIGSSLTLAERTGGGAEGSKYLERAQRSLAFMRRFLGQAAEATSLETALAEQELEPVNLSQLVAGRVHDYNEELAERKFVAAVEKDIWVSGNADRLVQMLDKLVNNAVEHGTVEHPIEIALRAEGGLAILSVRDIGDALPEDLEGIFEPFMSQKLRHGKGNLGLGLYVVRVIAARHGGGVRANRLQTPEGAELVVELPRVSPTPLGS